MGRFDAAALIASFQENYEDLLRFLARQTGDIDRAADLAQDTYLKLAAMGSSVGVIDNPRAYVYRVAGNLAIDTLRREGRIAARHTGTEPDESVPDPVPSPESALLSKEQLHLFDAALDELPCKARLALLYFRVEGLSHAAIATRLGVSESMVAKYIGQALRHCRNRLWQADQS